MNDSNFNLSRFKQSSAEKVLGLMDALMDRAQGQGETGPINVLKFVEGALPSLDDEQLKEIVEKCIEAIDSSASHGGQKYTALRIFEGVCKERPSVIKSSDVIDALHVCAGVLADAAVQNEIQFEANEEGKETRANSLMGSVKLGAEYFVKRGIKPCFPQEFLEELQHTVRALNKTSRWTEADTKDFEELRAKIEKLKEKSNKKDADDSDMRRMVNRITPLLRMQTQKRFFSFIERLLQEDEAENTHTNSLSA